VLLLDGPEEKLAAADHRKGQSAILVGTIPEMKENEPVALTIEQFEHSP
jgi:hypothetical protein